MFEHHDGFAMYASALSDGTTAKMGPQRDLVGDLASAVRTEGLHLGASSHRAEHNFFFDGGRAIQSDVNNPEYAALYGPAHTWLEATEGTPLENDFTFVSSAWTDDWLARSAEIVDKYHPDIMWFDWWIGQPAARNPLTRFAKRKGVLYTIELGWPANHEAIIGALTPATLASKERIQSIQLLGSEANLSFSRLPDGLHVRLPDRSAGKNAYAIRINFRSR